MLKKIYLLLRDQKSHLKSLVLGAAFFFGHGAGLNAQYAYTDCGENQSCTNSANSGFFSTVAADLSYDNVISSFHSSATYAQDGTIKVWGEGSRPVNVGSNTAHVNWFGVPTTINVSNGFNIDGQPLKIALASLYAKTGNNFGGAQYVLLTTTGKLYAWGFRGVLLDDNLTPTTGEAIQEVRTTGSGGGALGLPAGVNPTDVKMFFGTAGTLAMTTCGGDVYVLSQNQLIRQGGSATSWVRIQKAAGDGGGNLTNIVATRGTSAGLFALDANGDLWTWGYGTRLGTTGSGNGLNERQLATKMTLPNHSGSAIKMIAATKRFRNSGSSVGSGGSNTSTNSFEFSNNTISYFVLYEDGALYAMGENTAGQLGDFTNDNRNSWIQPRYASGGGDGNLMNNIKWISTQEHDGVIGFVSVINANKNLYNWGVESGSDMGRGEVSTTGYSRRDPGMPTNWETGNSNSNLLLVENGGHTTMVLQECKNTFGYVGHYRYGSMGDGRDGGTNTGDHFFRFTTSPLPICGIETTPANLTAASPTLNNEYCNSLGTIQLVGTPEGGVYKILEVDANTTNFQGLEFTDAPNDSPTGNLDLSNFNIPTNGSRTVRLGYVIPEGQSCAGDVVQLLITINHCTVYNIQIAGKIWIDVDEDAIDDASESNLANSGRWANLVNANGEVIASVPVDPSTGEYIITAGQNTLTSSGDYKIILTTNQRTPGANLQTGASAPAGYKYTGTNRSDGTNPATSGNQSEQSGILILGDLSSHANGSADVTLDDANFGVVPMIISGKVWHDPNGNAVEDGGEAAIDGTDDESTVWANLVGPDGKVVTSVGVGNDGTYEFTTATAGVAYKVILTSEKQDEGDDLSAGTLPGDWLATGTNVPTGLVTTAGANTGNKSNIIDLGPVTSSISGLDFGIQQPPTATDNRVDNVPVGETAEIPLIAGDDDDPEDPSIDPTTISLVPPSDATGIEDDDKGRIKKFTVPNEGTWEVDDDGNVTFTPETGFTDDPTPINYTVEDEAGATSNEATLTVTYLSEITISGKVWNDGNGDAQEDAGEDVIDGTDDDSTVWANLVDADGKVVASVRVGSDGTYEFTDVPAGVAYKIILTDEEQDEDETLTAGSLPDNWRATGTNYGGSADPGNRSNVIDLGPDPVTSNVEDADFGIQQLSQADKKEYEVPSQPATGTEILLNGETGNAPLMSGTDPEDGTYTGKTGTTNNPDGVVITSLPTNGVELYYDGVLVEQSDVDDEVVFEDPSLFSVKLTCTGCEDTEFTYAYVDAAGMVGEDNVYEITWGGPLPVRLVSFDAFSEGSAVRLEWYTAVEESNKGFVVERSADSRTWKDLGEVESRSVDGNSRTKLGYSFTDGKPLAGNNYYRLKQIDLDGTFTYSDVRVARIDRLGAAVRMYPNPVTDKITLADLQGSETIHIYDAVGRLVYDGKASGAVETIGLHNFAPGIYLIRITAEDGAVLSRKVMKGN